MRAVRWWLTPKALERRGPYYRNDWRARLRRVLTGWMPLALHHQVVRVELAVRFRERLRVVPKQGVPEPTAWLTQADMDWASRVAEELTRGEAK